MKQKDVVKLNAEAVRADLSRMGLSMNQVSLSMGKNDNYLACLLSRAERQPYNRETINGVERVLFREAGAYCLEVDQEEEPDDPVPVSGGQDYEGIRNAMADLYGMQKSLYDEVRSIHSDLKELLFAIKCDVGTTKEYSRRMREDTHRLTELWEGHK